MPVKKCLVCLSCAVLFFGCSRESTVAGDAVPKHAKGAKRIKIKGAGQELQETSILVQWHTNKLTLADVNRMVDLRAKMISLTRPADKAVTRNDGLAAQTMSAAPYWFPREQALLSFAATNNIVVGSELIAEMRKRSMMAANFQSTSWPKFLRKFTAEERRTLESRVAVESAAEAVRLWYEKNHPCSLSAEEIAKYRARQRSYNARAAATNELIYAQATNICKQIAAGLSFEDAANQYSTDEYESDGGEWGDFKLADFKDEPVVKDVVASLKPGDVSAPVEGDGGLMIIKFNDYTRGVDGEERYSLSRIFFHLPEFYPELDDKAFAAELRAARQGRMFKEFVKKLVDVNPPVFPSGDAVFEAARTTAANPVFL